MLFTEIGISLSNLIEPELVLLYLTELLLLTFAIPLTFPSVIVV